MWPTRARDRDWPGRTGPMPPAAQNRAAEPSLGPPPREGNWRRVPSSAKEAVTYPRGQSRRASLRRSAWSQPGRLSAPAGAAQPGLGRSWARVTEKQRSTGGHPSHPPRPAGRPVLQEFTLSWANARLSICLAVPLPECKHSGRGTARVIGPTQAGSDLVPEINNTLVRSTERRPRS